MYTGYFAKIKEYEQAGLIPISIAAKAPDWYDGLEYKKLAPKWSFFNEWKNGSHKGDNNYYTRQFYLQVLKETTVEYVIADLMGLSDGELSKVVLLCYEKPGDFCHRHLVADWINKYEGDNYIVEYSTPIDISKYYHIKKLKNIASIEKDGRHYTFKFNCSGAYTLDPSSASEIRNGWELKGKVQYDYFSWINSFEAKKGLDWVKGDFEKEVTCSSLKAFEDFLSNFEVESWDYADI